MDTVGVEVPIRFPLRSIDARTIGDHEWWVWPEGTLEFLRFSDSYDGTRDKNRARVRFAPTGGPTQEIWAVIERDPRTQLAISIDTAGLHVADLDGDGSSEIYFRFEYPNTSFTSGYHTGGWTRMAAAEVHECRPRPYADVWACYEVRTVGNHLDTDLDLLRIARELWVLPRPRVENPFVGTRVEYAIDVHGNGERERFVLDWFRDEDGMGLNLITHGETHGGDSPESMRVDGAFRLVLECEGGSTSLRPAADWCAWLRREARTARRTSRGASVPRRPADLAD